MKKFQVLFGMKEYYEEDLIGLWVATGGKVSIVVRVVYRAFLFIVFFDLVIEK
jgi:RNAse (barnase) inhibitor barstar